MDTQFSFVVGAAPIDQSLEFPAYSVVVDNPTNQWISLVSLGVVIPQYTLGATYPLPGTTRAQVSYAAPAGQVEPPIIAGQAATVTFHSLALPSTAGVGMLGGRAPYYDRNPKSFLFRYTAVNVSPHAGVIRWSYTVPSGRRAYVESCVGLVELEAAGDLPVSAAAGFAMTLVVVQPLGSPALEIVFCNIQDVAPARSVSSSLIGASMELQPGDLLSGQTGNTYTATKATHFVATKVTEFDV